MSLLRSAWIADRYDPALLSEIALNAVKHQISKAYEVYLILRFKRNIRVYEIKGSLVVIPNQQDT